MSSTSMQNGNAIESLGTLAFDMTLEIVVIPVSDVDRAKRFYRELGWRIDRLQVR